MFKRLIAELRDFVQMFYNPDAVYERNRRKPRAHVSRGDWIYPR